MKNFFLKQSEKIRNTAFKMYPKTERMLIEIEISTKTFQQE